MSKKLNLGISHNFPFLSPYSKNTKRGIVGEELYINHQDGFLTGGFTTLSSRYDLWENVSFAIRFQSGYELKWLNKSDNKIIEELELPYEFTASAKFDLEKFIAYYELNFKGERRPYEDEGLRYNSKIGIECDRIVNLRTGLSYQRIPFDLNCQDPKLHDEFRLSGGFGLTILSNIMLDFDASFSKIYFNDNSYSESQYHEINFGSSLSYAF